MKRIPSRVFACFVASAAAELTDCVLEEMCKEGCCCDGAVKVKPVIVLRIKRILRDRQRIERLIRAGLECHVSMIVPAARTTRVVVMMRRGGSVKPIHTGEAKRIRMNSVVSAGLVVAEVAVCWVDKKSVNRSIGSMRMLHLVVNVCRVATISSRDFRCLTSTSEGFRLCDFCFSPVQPVDDKGE